MTIENFIQDIKQNKYSPDYVRVIDGKTILFNYFDDKFYDVSNYLPNLKMITHACLERHINRKVELINFVRDVREDWGDDGGFCFYTGKYKGRFVLGSNFISYNGEFSFDFVNLNELEEKDENIEYMFFDTLEDIQLFIDKILSTAKKLTLEDEDWGYEAWELEEDNFESPFLHKCIRNLGSAFCEYQEQNTKNLQQLTNSTNYVFRNFDPVEFYNSWIVDNKIKPLF